MGAEFTFYDYREATNLVHDWLNTLPVPVKAKLNNRLLYLEALGPGQWNRPLVETLTGTCSGLFEVRASRAHIQYRLLGCHGPGDRDPTLLYGFIKTGRRVLKADCDKALARKRLVYASVVSHRAASIRLSVIRYLRPLRIGSTGASSRLTLERVSPSRSDSCAKLGDGLRNN